MCLIEWQVRKCEFKVGVICRDRGYRQVGCMAEASGTKAGAGLDSLRSRLGRGVEVPS